MIRIIVFCAALFLLRSTMAQELTNLGPHINSKLREMAPIVSPDGRTLYVMVYGHEQNKGNADIWYAQREDNSDAWSPIKSLPTPFNQITFNQLMSVTPDGNTLMVRGGVDAQGKPSMEGYSLIHRKRSGWGDPQPLVIEGYDEMVAGTMYAACLSNSAKILVLSLQEENKSNDLYVSFLENGKWTKPKSLGTDINTGDVEFSPFLASDDKTLYFSSNRPNGVGGYDIYFSRRLDHTWQNWSVPRNMGRPINSSGNETYFSLAASGEEGYISSTQESMGDYDIFSVALAASAKPEPVVMVHGRVLNEKTGAPLSAGIKFLAGDEGIDMGVAHSNAETGAYKVVLPYGQAYTLEANLSGFYAISDTINLNKTAGYQEIQMDLRLVPLEQSTTITFNHIFFETNSASLDPKSYKELEKLKTFLIENPDVKIEISGYTDNVGSEVFNKKLSKDRAESVRQWLLEQVGDDSRIISKGYGESQPVAPNETEEGRAKNRRVAFTILGG